jgi:RNA polymerase sigma factor (sigma-70 family)
MGTMALSGLDSVVCYLRRITPSGEVSDDGQLLARFAAGEEQAFAVLMNRYAGVVWAVCRRALPRQADAEDAFQATFLVLLRKAPALGRGGPLGPWLHRVASRTAVKARVRAARLADRESAAAVPEAAPGSAEPDGELRAVLDEEVNRLPEKYRLPVVLCYMEGLTNEQAADRLGCPRGTILSRLSRAREQLRRRLSRRGMDLPACLPVALPAVPATLVEAVLHGAVVRDVAFSTSVRTLAEGVLFGMWMHKLRLAALALLTLVAFAGAGVWAGLPAATDSPSAATSAAAAETPPKDEEKQTGGSAATADKKAKGLEEKPAAASAGLKIRDVLRKPIEWHGVDDPKVTLIEVLDQLTKMHPVTFEINDTAFKAEGIENVADTKVANPNPIPGLKAALARVLERILARVPAVSGAAFLIRKDHIEITTVEAIRRELGLRKRDLKPTDADERDDDNSRPALSPLVWEELKKVSLEKALHDIAENTGVNIVLDPRVQKIGDFEVTTTLRNVPVETAVEVLADMAGLNVVYRDNIVYVTTPENAERLLKSRRWSAEPQRLARRRLPAGAGM